MSITLKELEVYKRQEQEVLTTADLKHIENYKQLIAFFENSLADAVKEGKTDFPKLARSCMQSIRYLDNLINSYETALLATQSSNNLIDEIIKDNTPKMVGNEESELDQKSSE